MCVEGGLAGSSSTRYNATVCITLTASALTQDEERIFLHTYSSSLYSQSHHISTKDADDGWLVWCGGRSSNQSNSSCGSRGVSPLTISEISNKIIY